MSKIIGATVGTPTSPDKMKEALRPVQTVNGVSPDENGNVEIDVPEGGSVTDEQIGKAVDKYLEENPVVGTPGENGYSPVRGTDYWTSADIAEIKSYVDEAILGGAW